MHRYRRLLCFSPYTGATIAQITAAAAVAAATATTFLCLGLLLPAAARADERLAEWDFQGSSPYAPINGEHSSGLLFGRISFPQDDLREITAAVGNPAPSMTIRTVARELTSQNNFYSYLSIRIRPEAGYLLNLTSLSFDLAVNYDPLGTWNAGQLATGAVAVYGRPDPNFISPFVYTTLLGGAIVADATQDGFFPDFYRVTVDLTRPRYQGLTVEDELRLYFASTGESDFAFTPQDTPSDTLAIDNLLVTGTAVPLPSAATAAPEPGSLALLLPAIGAVSAVIRRRKNCGSVEIFRFGRSDSVCSPM